MNDPYYNNTSNTYRGDKQSTDLKILIPKDYKEENIQYTYQGKIYSVKVPDSLKSMGEF